MITNVTICDDSFTARKQVSRTLPEDWLIELSFAENGEECLNFIKRGKADIVLLDLNMPKVDGYQVLATILEQDLPCLAIVISGDIQPEALKRVKKLGAIAFIEKPVKKELLIDILYLYGILCQKDKHQLESPKQSSISNQPQENVIQQSHMQENLIEGEHFVLSQAMKDCYQEIANVAMGRAGDLLAKLLNVFVKLPIPNVNFIDVEALQTTLRAIDESETSSGVCQGFISAGIAGEALLILNDSSFKDIASLMNYPVDETELTSFTKQKESLQQAESLQQTESLQQKEISQELEYLMDLANILIGACLKGLSEQLDVHFSQGHLTVLGQHRTIQQLIQQGQKNWKKTLSIELSYAIEGYDIKCEVLLLFTEKSLVTLNHKLSYLIE